MRTRGPCWVSGLEFWVGVRVGWDRAQLIECRDIKTLFRFCRFFIIYYI